MAKLLSSSLLSVFLLCSLSPASVYADRYQARFELVDSVGLSFGLKTSTDGSSQCSQSFDARNIFDPLCYDLSVSMNDPFQQEAVVFMDGEQHDWKQSQGANALSTPHLAKEISLILQ